MEQEMQTLTQFLLIEVGFPRGRTAPFNQIFPDITFYKTGVLWRFMSWITNVLFCTCVSTKREKSYTRAYIIQPLSAILISYLKTILCSVLCRISVVKEPFPSCAPPVRDYYLGDQEWGFKGVCELCWVSRGRKHRWAWGRIFKDWS